MGAHLVRFHWSCPIDVVVLADDLLSYISSKESAHCDMATPAAAAHCETPASFEPRSVHPGVSLVGRPSKARSRQGGRPVWLPRRLHFASDVVLIALGGKFPAYVGPTPSEPARFEWLRLAEYGASVRMVGRIDCWKKQHQQQRPCATVAVWLVGALDNTVLASFCSDTRHPAMAWIEWTMPQTDFVQESHHQYGNTVGAEGRTCRAVYSGDDGRLTEWEWIDRVAPANNDCLLVNDETRVVGP